MASGIVGYWREEGQRTRWPSPCRPKPRKLECSKMRRPVPGFGLGRAALSCVGALFSHEIWPVHAALVARTRPQAPEPHPRRNDGADRVRRGTGLRFGMAGRTPLHPLRHRTLGGGHGPVRRRPHQAHPHRYGRERPDLPEPGFHRRGNGDAGRSQQREAGLRRGTGAGGLRVWEPESGLQHPQRAVQRDSGRDSGSVEAPRLQLPRGLLQRGRHDHRAGAGAGAAPARLPGGVADSGERVGGR